MVGGSPGGGCGCGATTDLGQSTKIGTPSGGIALNNKGQAARNVRIDGSPDTLVVLTPTAPQRAGAGERPADETGAPAAMSRKPDPSRRTGQ